MPRPRAEHKPYRIGLAWRIALRNSATAVKRRTVDDSLVLSIKELFDQGLIGENAFRAGSLSWRNVDTFQFHGTIWYEADLRNPEGASLRLRYEMDGLEMDYGVPVAFTEPSYGGRRWYFRCPVQHIRVTKLFLPPGARRFASRQAHDLTYRSMLE
jgi:hypothetical protein